LVCTLVDIPLYYVSDINLSQVVGAEEMKARTVNIRNRDDPSSQAKGVMVPLEEAREKLRVLRKERRLVNEL
jgi:threonyl-tRNA synthetase